MRKTESAHRKYECSRVMHTWRRRRVWVRAAASECTRREERGGGEDRDISRVYAVAIDIRTSTSCESVDREGKLPRLLSAFPSYLRISLSERAVRFAGAYRFAQKWSLFRDDLCAWILISPVHI